jgi:hypothetical protein
MLSLSKTGRQEGLMREQVSAKSKSRSLAAVVTVAVTLVLLTTGCLSTVDDVSQNGSETPEVPATATDVWLASLERTPFPYLLPVPDPKRTVLDGTYTKIELKEIPPVHCLRCPDYASEGGTWKLNLDKGVFRIFHQVTGWHSVGSFVVTRDRWTGDAQDQLLLINDPACPDAIGLYTWRLEEGSLILEVVDDTCAIHLRAANLTNLPWLSCQPPNTEARISDHWVKPPGCD